MNAKKADRAWQILSSPILDRTCHRAEFWDLVSQLFQDCENWHRRWVSRKVFFDHYSPDSVEVEEVSKEILDEVLEILMRLFNDAETRRGLSPDPGMGVKAYICRVMKKRNHIRKYQNAYRIDEVQKDWDAQCLKSPKRGMLVFASFDSLEERQSQTTQDGGRHRSRMVWADPVDDCLLSRVEDAAERTYTVSKYVESLDDAWKMAYLLVECGLASAPVDEIKAQAAEIGMSFEAICRYGERIECVSMLRRRGSLTHDQIASVLNISRAELRRILKALFDPPKAAA